MPADRSVFVHPTARLTIWPPPAPAPLVDIAPTGEHRVQPSAPQRTALRQTAQDPVADLTLPAVTGPSMISHSNDGIQAALSRQLR